jgi:hypothetical protein
VFAGIALGSWSSWCCMRWESPSVAVFGGLARGEGVTGWQRPWAWPQWWSSASGFDVTYLVVGGATEKPKDF